MVNNLGEGGDRSRKSRNEALDWAPLFIYGLEGLIFLYKKMPVSGKKIGALPEQ